MSRLDQMRQHFLKRVLSEQQHLFSHSSLSWAKSVHNISIQQLPWTPISFHSMQSVNSGLGGLGDVNKRETRANIQRVKSLASLNNVCLEQLNRTGSKSANDKQSIETTKRNLTPNVNSDATNSANIANVNKPCMPANRYGSRVLSIEHKRATANSTRNELACKHCARKFFAKERLDKHMDICEKTRHKQRAVFDSAKQRLKEHLPSDAQLAQANDDPETAGNVSTDLLLTENHSEPKPSWNSAHQQLLMAIKEAKLRRAVSIDNAIDTQCEPIQDSPGPVKEGSCSYCKRTFGLNVITKHETICGKLFRKKYFNI